MSQQEPIRPQFAEAMQEYLSDCRRRGFTAYSLYSYEKALAKFFLWTAQQYAGIEHLSEINRQVIADYQMFLYRSSSRWEKPLSVATQHRWLGIVLWFFRWMAAAEKLLLNPAASIRLPRRAQRIPRNYLSLRETQKLLKAPDLDTHMGLRNRAILEVLYSTGLRNAELRKLKIEDINLQDGWLTVREGKGGKDRVVPLGKAALHFILFYMEKTRPALLKRKRSSILFLNQYGKPMSHDSLNTLVKKTARLAGITRTITPHSLRHTCATLMLRGKADIRHIQEMLGHSSLSSTQIYTRVEIGDLKKVHAKCHPREKQAIEEK
jgi:integrase/recombinase XerD